MASRYNRYRSSTSASTAPALSKAAEVLQSLLGRAASVVKARASSGYPDLESLTDQTRRIHQHIAASDPPCPQQDDFRRLGGFQAMLDILYAFSGFYNPEKRSVAEMEHMFGLLHVVLAIISTAVRKHPGNRRYFKHKGESGGWDSLEQAVASLGLGGSDSDLWASCQLFGKLLSFALDDQRLDGLCQLLAHTKSPVDGDGKAAATDGDESLGSIEAKLHEIVGPETVLRNPEIMRTVVGFWQSMRQSDPSDPNLLSLLVLETLSSVAAVSFYNLSSLHSTEILPVLLRVLFGASSTLNVQERAKAEKTCRALMALGLNKLADTQFLLSSQDAAASEFCLDVANRYSGPPLFQFDLSLHGHSSIELPTLGGAFPPQSSAGYTVSLWFRVDQFDRSSHTTLFGVFDATQTCFLLAYLERDTHNFILQTSVTSQRPSVRFKSVTFKAGQWYHLVIVHRRPKTITASKASLYVDGELVEQIKAAYPLPPPLSTGSTDSFASLVSNSSKSSPVQAFLGTPRDLSNQLGPGLVSSRWSLASAHLFEDVLSDDLLAVHYRLGPRYQGNFQDRLGGFQTYEASAALALRNEFLHPGKEEKSDIIRAVRDKASTIFPEHKILMSILPASVVGQHSSLPDSTLFRALSRHAANSLYELTTQYGAPVAINCAVPSINDALARSSGAAMLVGDPTLAVPLNFDDNLWRVGGFTAVALKLVERAATADELLRSVELMFICINRSWRNSEAMERESGYAILAMLLRAKLGYGATGTENIISGRLTLGNDERDKLTFRLLSLVLGFVGYKHADPRESFIINPLGYRVLLIDLDVWRRAAPITQELYYKQFITFAVESKHNHFNSRRLLRMRIVKRLLDALKAESLSEAALPHFVAAFECLVRCNYNAEVHRSVALFITYSLHSPAVSQPRTPKPLSILSRSSTPSNPRRATTSDINGAGAALAAKTMTRRQVGIRLLELYAEMLCEKNSAVNIHKFAKTVTNKVTADDGSTRNVYTLTAGQWLLYLLSEDDAEVVVFGSKILARLLVTQPPSYTAKFASKTGGFWIMAHRLRHWWDVPTLWPVVFSILFGNDVADIDFDRPFGLTSLLELFGKRQYFCADVLLVLAAMLQNGLRDILRYQDDPDSPSREVRGSVRSSPVTTTAVETRPRARSMALAEEMDARKIVVSDKDRVHSHASILHTVVRFLAAMHSQSPQFRDFALSSDYVRLLLSLIYPIIVSSDPVTPETELNSKDGILTFEGGDVMIRPIPGSTGPAPIVKTVLVANQAEASMPLPSPGQRGTPLRRPSSFILVSAEAAPQNPNPARLTHVMSPKKRVATQQVSNGVLEGLLELMLAVFNDQVLARAKFNGFGLFLRVPPGFQEHQAYFETYVLRHAITSLGSAILQNQRILCEPRVLTNLWNFSTNMSEAIYEGWFMNGAGSLLDFTGTLLEYLQRPEISSMKSVRLCSVAVSGIRAVFLRLVLLRLSDMDDPQTTDAEATSTMERMLYWQAVLLNCLGAEDIQYLKLLWYQLYMKLIDTRESIRLAAATLWRVLLVQMPEESATVFRQCMPPDQQPLARGFRKLTEVDDSFFVDWVDQHRPALDIFFFGAMSKIWEDFVGVENQRSLETAKSRVRSRRERLRHWHQEHTERDNVVLRHEFANGAWMKSIYYTEHFRHQRLMQDQQDDLAYHTSAFAKMDRNLRRPGAVFSEPAALRWKLDRTEGRNRMRLRLLPDHTAAERQQQYQPKRRNVDAPAAAAPKLNTGVVRTESPHSVGGTPRSATPLASADGPKSADEDDELADTEPDDGLEHSAHGVAPEDDYELVEDPNDQEGDDGFEDKNRKVMRRLEHGDAVQHVYNMSRIIGLEACEGILIIGKDALYLMDNVFQCADGEIVNVWQAPPDERDPYSQIIAGPKALERPQAASGSGRSEQESRSWRWHDVISVSKRRFLFRDVAIEVFFTDGRSYLLTAITPAKRDEVFGKLISKAPHTVGNSALPNPEDMWRLEAIKVLDDAPKTFGSKFGGMFNASPWNPFVRRWQKGEMSNFHYLMLVNTMAGRTFNDLTQYPVFPWVLADYTSEELDLDDPATFRDLSKPMGAQTAARQADFRMRYNSLEEIGETPFHYGTHYSSAMIVSSFLIRLPPFVQSFILLQGGTFDHPDRLFFSVAGAWNSASKDNGTDVRELIPEFYYLPDFLTNINGYDFGTRQGTGGKVHNVILPPWAKGDPSIFIAKHREALESPYVSQNLHHWIDLVFGFKQRGEAAVENLNVFHHLSYHGARDLDDITDPKEKAITTGIIHNFGQTPHQIFSRPHPPREHAHCHVRRLDTSVQALTKLPYPLLESRARVASLVYAPKQDRLLCAPPLRLNIPPLYDKFLEWGYADNSVRFFHSDNRKPAGLFEALHLGQLSCLAFADAKTLITAGEDCVVSVFAVQQQSLSSVAPAGTGGGGSSSAVELLPRSSLFGHKTPVTTIAVSRTLSTILTVSRDGVALLWDLNRLEFVRRLPLTRSVECAVINNVSGEILLCSGPSVLLYSLNGELLLDQNVCATASNGNNGTDSATPPPPRGVDDDFVVSCAFYEGAANEWLENFLVFTGHRRGRVNVWRRAVDARTGKWVLEPLRRLDHVDTKSETGANVDASITCIAPMPQVVYTGDEEGRVYEWNLVQRER